VFVGTNVVSPKGAVLAGCEAFSQTAATAVILVAKLVVRLVAPMVVSEGAACEAVSPCLHDAVTAATTAVANVVQVAKRAASSAACSKGPPASAMIATVKAAAIAKWA